MSVAAVTAPSARLTLTELAGVAAELQRRDLDQKRRQQLFDRVVKAREAEIAAAYGPAGYDTIVISTATEILAREGGRQLVEDAAARRAVTAEKERRAAEWRAGRAARWAALSPERKTLLVIAHALGGRNTFAGETILEHAEQLERDGGPVVPAFFEEGERPPQ